MAPPVLNGLLNCLMDQGHAQYGGEAVSQLEHALQCATLAQAAQAPRTLIVACLLHDIGHLSPAGAVKPLAPVPLVPPLTGGHRASTPPPQDWDPHETRAMAYLSPYLPPAVTAPIRWHVAAKRYLCQAEPAYGAQLSAASQASLRDQGGPFTPTQAQAFLAQPYAWDAVRLRRWDDQAKVPHRATPPLAAFWPLVTQLWTAQEDAG